MYKNFYQPLLSNFEAPTQKQNVTYKGHTFFSDRYKLGISVENKIQKFCEELNLPIYRGPHKGVDFLLGDYGQFGAIEVKSCKNDATISRRGIKQAEKYSKTYGFCYVVIDYNYGAKIGFFVYRNGSPVPPSFTYKNPLSIWQSPNDGKFESQYAYIEDLIDFCHLQEYIERNSNFIEHKG